MGSVKDFKAKIQEQLGIPVRSQKLKTDVFLKDAWTLAKYNLTPGSFIQLAVQKRGGQN